MVNSKRARSRKATWLAFGLVAFAAASRAAEYSGAKGQITYGEDDASSTTYSTPDASATPAVTDDNSREAERAYKKAVSTLRSLASLPSPSPLSTHTYAGSSLDALIASLFPQRLSEGPGPVANAIRIVSKLRQQASSYITRTLAWGEARRGREKEREERRAVKVVDLLSHAASLGHMDALFTLAKIGLLPPTHHFTYDPVLAYDSFHQHALATGNATSQFYLGVLHSAVSHSNITHSQSLAQTYYTFAALSGSKSAQMALGSRYWSGIGVAEDCFKAVAWYEAAAEQTYAKFLSGPPGGRTLPLTSVRMSDLQGGVFGPGASAASTGMSGLRAVVKAARAQAAGETWEDIVEYYMYNADRGEPDFLYRLGKIFYQGSIYSAPGGIASGGEGAMRVPRDFARARYHFEKLARSVWPVDPRDPLQHAKLRNPDDQPKGGVGLQSAAAAYLARMHLRGEGVPKDPRKARMWAERGAEYGDKECHNLLGIIWRDGVIDGRKDLRKALTHFHTAASQELAEAQVNLGKHAAQKGDLKLAATYFESAMRHGSPFEAYYHLAMIHSRTLSSVQPAMRAATCSMATSFFKVAAERASWATPDTAAWGRDDLRAGELAYERGDIELALMHWRVAAERGVEAAQNNVAWALDADRSMLARETVTIDSAKDALKMWTRSAAQNNVDALVKVGDYYFHGLGIPSESSTSPSSTSSSSALSADERASRAAAYYQSAADTQLSALAMWNLGWMYENGVGVAQDFHLAKRHYDGALEMNAEAYLPVTISLAKLYARSAWHTLLGREGGLGIWKAETDEEIGEEARREIEGAREREREREEQRERQEAEERYGEGDDEGGWYMGRARDEFNRRRLDARDDDDDPIKWAYERRREERDRDTDYGPEDYFDGALRPNREEFAEEDEVFETAVLIGLCVVVSLLLYVRGRMVERMRREERDRRDGEQREGDPAREEWAVPR
ncbi:HCP-like protein [Peniophora sp. CONT]|nr:HCP-like protein [Peniophora sp. CONT]